MAKHKETFDEALDALIENAREEGEWIDEIIASLELAQMMLENERDN